MKIDIFTLFPGWFDWFLEQRHVRNALALGSSLETVDLRATTPLKAGQVDDTPYGGGAGMVIRVDVVEAALTARYGNDRGGRRVIALAPGGRPFDDALATELAREDALTLLSGRYEGFDERVNEHLATDVISIGPYVLSGGELAAMVVCDAVLRKLPGALGHEESARRGVVQRGTRGRARIPALHAPVRLAWPHRARDPVVGRPRQGARMAARAQPRAPAGVPTSLRYHSGSRDRPVGRSRLFYVRRHRKHRACPAAARARLPVGRPRARALPGRRGHPPAHAGVRGRCDQAPGQRRPRDLHGAQAVVRRGRGADVPPALAEDRADRGGVARRRAPGQALLPARPRRSRGPGARAPLDGSRGRAGLRRGGHAPDDAPRPGEEELAEVAAAEEAAAAAAEVGRCRGRGRRRSKRAGRRGRRGRSPAGRRAGRGRVVRGSRAVEDAAPEEAPAAEDPPADEAPTGEPDADEPDEQPSS